MRRRLFSLASLLSLLLCVATVVLWVRSYSRIDAVRGPLGHERVFAAKSDVGEIDLCCVRYLNYEIPRKDAQFKAGSFARDFNGVWHSARLWPAEALDVSDFMQSKTWSYHEGEVHVFNDPQIPPTYKTVRFWMRFRTACATLLILPTGYLLLRLSKLRRRHSQACPTCGYNLTGNTSGVCPECGTACTTSENRLQKIPPVPQGEK